MTVSIVLPTYNRRATICRAIESALAQTYQKFEVLAIDDGSADDTAQVVAGVTDSRIRLIRHDRNRGYSAAINTGLKEARGNLVSFLDSDDTWKPEKLELEVSFLRKHPEVQAVFSDLEKRDGQSYYPSFMRTTPVFSTFLGRGSYPEGIALEQRAMYLCLLQEIPIKPSALTLRAESVRKAGLFEESWPSGSDWEFLLRFAKIGRFGYIDRPLASMEVMADATHRRHFVQDKLLMLDLLRRERSGLLHDPVGFAAACRGTVNLTKHLGWFYMDVGKRANAAWILLRGFRETRDSGLLIRGMAAVLPTHLRLVLKRVAITLAGTGGGGK